MTDEAHELMLLSAGAGVDGRAVVCPGGGGEGSVVGISGRREDGEMEVDIVPGGAGRHGEGVLASLLRSALQSLGILSSRNKIDGEGDVCTYF